jgi:hypothetical protein
MPLPIPDYGISFSDSSLVSNKITAEKNAELFLKEQLSLPTYSHNLSHAQLWVIKKDGTFSLIDALPDVYDLLNTSYNLSSYDGVIVHTTGWAAPLDDDAQSSVSPSNHSQRRRVALATCAMASSVGSAISFKDEEDLITDPGSATGSLADALLRFWQTNQ